MHPSTLAERLRGIVRVPAPPPVSRPVDAAVVPPVEDPPRTLEAELGGQWVTGDRGRCFAIERRLEASEPYGRATVGEFGSRIGVSAGEASVLGTAAPLPFVFFDLETTGLSGGAGSFAFLVGCGWFERDGGFVTRQYLLTRAGDERAMLEAVRSDLARAGALVSFNGKSFDVPVLGTRYALHRVVWDDIAGRTHFDVLHPARRFWSRAAEAAGSCSLSALEQHILHVRRVGDVAGAEIPWRYFQFIRSGDPRPLRAVLEHNRHDLVSLAGLTARLLHLVADGPSESDDAGELLALGRAYARAGRDTLSREAFDRAVEEGQGTRVAIEARRWLAIGARRSRRYEEAARHWQIILDTAGCPSQVVCEASEALAVHHEHRARDLGLARTYAVKSLETGARPTWTDAARYRLARLDRKMAMAPLFELDAGVTRRIARGSD